MTVLKKSTLGDLRENHCVATALSISRGNAFLFKLQCVVGIADHSCLISSFRHVVCSREGRSDDARSPPGREGVLMHIVSPTSCCCQDYHFCIVYPATEREGVSAQMLNWKAVQHGKPFPFEGVVSDGKFLYLCPTKNDSFRVQAVEVSQQCISTFLGQAKCKKPCAIVETTGSADQGSSRGGVSRTRNATVFYTPTDSTKDRGNNGNGGRSPVESSASDSQDVKAIVAEQLETVTKRMTDNVTSSVLQALEKEKDRDKQRRHDTRRTPDDPEKQDLMKQVLREKDKNLTMLEEKNKEMLAELRDRNKKTEENAKEEQANTKEFALQLVAMLTNSKFQGMKRKEPTPSGPAE